MTQVLSCRFQSYLSRAFLVSSLTLSSGPCWLSISRILLHTTFVWESDIQQVTLACATHCFHEMPTLTMVLPSQTMPFHLHASSNHIYHLSSLSHLQSWLTSSFSPGGCLANSALHLDQIVTHVLEILHQTEIVCRLSWIPSSLWWYGRPGSSPTCSYRCFLVHAVSFHSLCASLQVLPCPGS